MSGSRGEMGNPRVQAPIRVNRAGIVLVKGKRPLNLPQAEELSVSQHRPFRVAFLAQKVGSGMIPHRGTAQGVPALCHEGQRGKGIQA